jgi:hypothetical protein
VKTRDKFILKSDLKKDFQNFHFLKCVVTFYFLGLVMIVPTSSNLRIIKSIFPAGFARMGVLNKDSMVWLDGA